MGGPSKRDGGYVGCIVREGGDPLGEGHILRVRT